MYKCKIGQIVETERSIFDVIPAGQHEILRRMPPTVTGQDQYQTKSPRDGHERVVKERDLSASRI